MNDDSVDPDNISPASESGYEPPAVFDFGPVFKTTRGSSGGTKDGNNQED